MISRWLVPFVAVLVLAACGSPAPTAPPVSTAPIMTPYPTAPSVASPIATVPSTTEEPVGNPTARPTLEPRPTPAEGAFQPLVVDDFGFTAVPGDAGNYATFAAVFSNPNTEWAVYRMLVQINFFGSDDAFVGGAEMNVTVLPGQTTAVSGQAYGAGDAVRMLVAVPEDPTPYFPFAPSGTIEVTDVAFATGDTGTLTTGVLTSSLTSDQNLLQLFAVYRDDSGAIVGGTPGAIEAIESGASVPFEISEAQPPPNATAADVYWQLGGQLP